MPAYAHSDPSRDRAGRPGWSYDRYRPGWLARAEAWLDARGRGAWIVAMVLSFIFFWPLGLALLAYMIWSKRMFGHCAHRGRHHNFHARHTGGQTGNAAFDAYKADTLARLEHEQTEFEAFMRRLRESRDKAEFDQYMDERAQAAAESGGESASDDKAGTDRY
ncbi:DUF2852 domain-containing protein [Phaeovulum sp.]|uniref:DUF2852 domain-containing protein n=1 Tax=Phaeovulum sp. TaxID=2934796 RepID=UPI0039E3C136